MQEQTVKRKPFFAIVVAAVITLAVLAGIYLTYNIFSKSYDANLGKLEQLVAEAEAQFAAGDETPNAAPDAQYRFYVQLGRQAENLADILEKLNARYPLLLGHESEESTGIAGLKQKLAALTPGLEAFRECIDEDTAIASALTGLLGGGAHPGLSGEYSALAARNAAFGEKAAGLSFSGALETSRSAMADAAARRGVALGFLVEDAAVNEELAGLLEDALTEPKDLIAKFSGLLQKNEELAGKAAEADVEGYSSGGVGIEGMLSARKDQLKMNIDYLTEIMAVQAKVLAFNKKMGDGVAAGGKYSVRLASYMAWVKDLKVLVGQMQAVNGNQAYSAVVHKRSLASIGLSPEGQALSGHSAALMAASNGVATSAAMEKEITALMGNTKLGLVARTNALENLIEKNDLLIASLPTAVPEDLAPGLANFAAGCKERKVFLNEYLTYVYYNRVAESHSANRSGYLKQRQEYLNLAAAFPDGSSDREFYEDLAHDQATFASDSYNKYKAALTEAEKHKKAYTASRKKYLPLLDK